MPTYGRRLRSTRTRCGASTTIQRTEWIKSRGFPPPETSGIQTKKQTGKKLCQAIVLMAPRVGIEPTTNGLTVRRSTAELPGNKAGACEGRALSWERAEPSRNQCVPAGTQVTKHGDWQGINRLVTRLFGRWRESSATWRTACAEASADDAPQLPAGTRTLIFSASRSGP